MIPYGRIVCLSRLARVFTNVYTAEAFFVLSSSTVTWSVLSMLHQKWGQFWFLYMISYLHLQHCKYAYCSMNLKGTY